MDGQRVGVNEEMSPDMDFLKTPAKFSGLINCLTFMTFITRNSIFNSIEH